jgi:hypothetical protein
MQIAKLNGYRSFPSRDATTISIEQRWNMMWHLAVNAWAMKGENVAEQEFQRDIERIARLRD